MPSDLEDRLRSALDVMPDEVVGERLRARLTGDTPPPRRRGLRHTLTRAARPAVAVAGIALLVAVMALLVIAAPDDPPAAAEGTGVEMVLRAIPDDPGAGDRATARLAEILEGQRDARGISGMTVTVEGDRVRVFVPRTHDPGWPRGLLVGLNAGVYDLGADSVVADRSLARVLDAVELPPAGSEPSHFYAVAPANDPGQSYLGGPYATAQEARAAAGFPGRPAPRVARVPATTALVLGDDPVAGGTFRFLALTDPVVAPGAISGARVEDGRLVLQIAPSAREAVARRLAAADASDLALTGAPGIPQVFTGVHFAGADAAGGALSFRVDRGGADETAGYLAGGGIDASVAVEGARPVGPAPARAGDRPARLPAVFRRMSSGDMAEDPFRPRAGSVLRLLETEVRGTRWSLWSYLSSRDGMEMVTTIGPGDGAGSGGCPIAPDHPLVFICGGGSGYQVAGVGRTMHGRVGEDVAAVTLTLADGRAFPATVRNGFFLLVLPPGVRGTARLEARDAAGALLGTVDANGPGELPEG